MINPVAAPSGLPQNLPQAFTESTRPARPWQSLYLKFTVVLVAAVLAMAI